MDDAFSKNTSSMGSLVANIVEERPLAIDVQRIYVPKVGELIRLILEEAHYSPYSIYPAFGFNLANIWDSDARIGILRVPFDLGDDFGPRSRRPQIHVLMVPLSPKR
ncbi:hypothetical protein MTR67_002101 [Solanum verrucosum]|uniref:Uncharacterized protein n=1 Tax=Solanum verrucosum TaxID=315347 RepID=A0AAF0PQB6_SOLVR|nr:hypothetical protein MTR67_002101 [Solanum verrucosum]